MSKPIHPTVRSVCRLHNGTHILVTGPIHEGCYPALDTAGFSPMRIHSTDISAVLGEVDLRMTMHKGTTGA